MFIGLPLKALSTVIVYVMENLLSVFSLSFLQALSQILWSKDDFLQQKWPELILVDSVFA